MLDNVLMQRPGCIDLICSFLKWPLPICKEIDWKYQQSSKAVGRESGLLSCVAVVANYKPTI